jgi:hypothetical protein
MRSPFPRAQNCRGAIERHAPYLKFVWSMMIGHDAKDT